MRRFVAGQLDGHPCGDDAELLASELMTNAVTHGDGGDPHAVTVSLAATDALVRVSVADHGQHPPCVCRLGRADDLIGEDAPEHGRGLVLLDRLVDGCGGQWGFDRDGRGSTVWFELHADERTYRSPGPYPATETTRTQATQYARSAARDLDRAYRTWRRTQGLTDPAEVSSLGYAAFLPSTRLHNPARVLLGMPAHEGDALARFLAAHSVPGGP